MAVQKALLVKISILGHNRQAVLGSILPYGAIIRMLQIKLAPECAIPDEGLPAQAGGLHGIVDPEAI